MSKSTGITDSDVNNLWWVVTIALGLLGVYVLTEGWKAGLMLLAATALISPYCYSRVLAYMKSGDSLHLRVLIVLFALAGSTYVFNDQVTQRLQEAAEEQKLQAQENARIAEEKRVREAEEQTAALKAYFAEHRDEVLAEFSAAIDARDVSKADQMQQQYAQFAQDPELAAIDSRLQVLKVQVEQEKKEQARKDRISELLANTKTLGATDYGQAIAIYTELSSLDPSNKGYKQTMDRFTKAEETRVAKAEKAQRESEAKANHQKKIEDQFSSWDGAHRQFERLIKKNMNDPSSYDHIETRYTDKGSYIRVYCKFRGKNGFGGTVIQTEVADYSINGDFIKFVE
ncbi:hypothetical protein [Pseudomonas sp. BE134]|uniref:hypothetical protein n=1 Tax=Pseudomonas sp. BE134 TaxID=2817843 RepID=UPI002857BE41|nr:hypothetical protein [Pseudomonas sp. BE134]MDR6924805.1 hypothetical protein [Pseudomonas sp. BE134]